MVVPEPVLRASAPDEGPSSDATVRRRARRALLGVYSPIQTAVWMNAHAEGDPREVAAKAMALAGSGHRAGRDASPSVTSWALAEPSGEPDGVPAGPPQAATTPGAVVGTDREGRSGGGGPLSETEAQAVVIRTMRAMVDCRDADEVRSLVFEATYALGGRIAERARGPEPTVPIDLSDGAPARFAIGAAADAQSRVLSTHLPPLVGHGRAVVAWMRRLSAFPVQAGTSVAIHDRVTYQRLAGRVRSGDIVVSLDVEAAGDPVEADRLRGILAEVLRQEVRVDEPVASLGPDGFLVVLRTTDVGASQQLLRRVRRRWDAQHRCSVAVVAGVAAMAGGIDEALAEATRSRTADTDPGPGDPSPLAERG